MDVPTLPELCITSKHSFASLRQTKSSLPSLPVARWVARKGLWCRERWWVIKDIYVGLWSQKDRSVFIFVILFWRGLLVFVVVLYIYIYVYITIYLCIYIYIYNNLKLARGHCLQICMFQVLGCQCCKGHYRSKLVCMAVGPNWIPQNIVYYRFGECSILCIIDGCWDISWSPMVGGCLKGVQMLLQSGAP